MNVKLYIAILVIFILSPGLAFSATQVDGERLYNSGQLASGDYVEAFINGDISVSGAQLACVSCHRKSRLGSSEGQIEVPPLDYQSLYYGDDLSVNEQRGVAQQGVATRSVYTDELLAQAITEGIKPDGQLLNDVMPRYQLDDEIMDGLIAYIKSFKADDDPSVTETDIHLATVYSDEDPASARLMNTVLDDFFTDKNANIRHETRRAKHTPWTREWWYKSYRKVVLHQWVLTGSPESWADQLDSYYKQQPIFAMVSGLASDWKDIDLFCESNRIPCLLPNIIQPPARASYYTRYFYPGLEMEAAVLARMLNEDPVVTDIFLLFDAASPAQQSVSAFETMLNMDKSYTTLSTQQFLDVPLHASDEANTRTAVYWGDISGLSSRLVARLKAAKVSRLCLSATLVSDINVVRNLWSDDLCVVSPYRHNNRRFDDARTLAWLHRKGLADEANMRLKFNTYYAAKLVSDAITAIRGNFSRDFFIEKIEHMVDKSLIKPDFAHLSLGPGQRFLSRGAYVLVSDAVGDELTIGRDWIIPY